MWETEIRQVLQRVPGFLGVFSRDDMKSPRCYPFSLVVNTDKSDQQGTHWIAIYVDSKGRGIYYDPFGRKPHHSEFEEYLIKYCKNGYTYNKSSLQCITCVTCGEYSTAYVIFRTVGYSHRRFIQIFSSDTISNDILIKNLFNKIKTMNLKFRKYKCKNLNKYRNQ